MNDKLVFLYDEINRHINTYNMNYKIQQTKLYNNLLNQVNLFIDNKCKGMHECSRGRVQKHILNKLNPEDQGRYNISSKINNNISSKINNNIKNDKFNLN